MSESDDDRDLDEIAEIVITTLADLRDEVRRIRQELAEGDREEGDAALRRAGGPR